MVLVECKHCGNIPKCNKTNLSQIIDYDVIGNIYRYECEHCGVAHTIWRTDKRIAAKDWNDLSINVIAPLKKKRYKILYK